MTRAWDSAECHSPKEILHDALNSIKSYSFAWLRSAPGTGQDVENPKPSYLFTKPIMISLYAWNKLRKKAQSLLLNHKRKKHHKTICSRTHSKWKRKDPLLALWPLPQNPLWLEWACGSILLKTLSTSFDLLQRASLNLSPYLPTLFPFQMKQWWNKDSQALARKKRSEFPRLALSEAG